MPAARTPRRSDFVPLTERERAEAIDKVRLFARKLVRPSGLPEAAQDDAYAQAICDLWATSAKFDPTGPAKFSTFAGYVIQKSLLRYHQDLWRQFPAAFGGRAFKDFDCVADHRPGPDADHLADPEPPKVDALTLLIRKLLFSDLLDLLAPATRTMIEATVFDGLSVGQVAEQRGMHPKMANLIIRQALVRLAGAGKVPADLARACGLDAAVLAAWSRDPKAMTRERRAKVAELHRQGLDRKAIAEPPAANVNTQGPAVPPPEQAGGRPDPHPGRVTAPAHFARPGLHRGREQRTLPPPKPNTPARLGGRVAGPPRLDQFWTHVQAGDGCWLWAGERKTNGYGWFVIDRGRPGGRRQRFRFLAHRTAYELVHGPIPAGLFALHRCDVRLCCRPDHLFLGTQRDNIHDMTRKGRCRTAKLTPDQVRAIRARLARGDGPTATARAVGANVRTVEAIRKGKSYAWVTDEQGQRI